jgi:CheY-like chemotaxis protein
MDVQMPVMDGFQTTAEIRASADPEKARVPIIAMTAHALKGDAERCLAAGMDAYVSKPIQAEEFLELVEILGEDEGGPETGALATAIEDTPETRDEPPDKPAPVFDVNEAVGRCFGKYEFFLDMVAFFFAETDEMLESLHEARRQGRTGEVSTIAHRLKNTVVYLAAQPAMQAILKVEIAANDGELVEIDKALSQLAHQLERLKNSLSAYRKRDSMNSNLL